METQVSLMHWLWDEKFLSGISNETYLISHRVILIIIRVVVEI